MSRLQTILPIVSGLALITSSASAQLTVDTDLGTISPGLYTLLETTVGEPSEACAYRDTSLLYGGFAEFGGEVVYHFRVLVPSVLFLANNEGIFVGTDQDHYLLQGNSTTPNVDIFSDGSVFCTVGENLIGFVDEEGDFGVTLQPGIAYFLSVDTYDLDGPFNITLFVNSTLPLGDANCDGVVDLNDADAFCLALNDPFAYPAAYPDCFLQSADINEDAQVDLLDEILFCEIVFGGSGHQAGCAMCNLSDVVVVDDDWPGPGADPLAVTNSIQQGIDMVVDGGEVRVKAGTYREHLDLGTKNLTLTADPPDASVVVNGDLDNNGTGDGRPLNVDGGQNSSTQIIGLTFSHGRVTSASPGGDDGGGVRIVNSSPVFIDCDISNCTALGVGGGVYVGGGSPEFFSTRIDENTASGNGGGVALRNGANAVFTDCRVSDNIGANGGGIIADGATGSFLRSDIRGNAAQASGAQGGGVYTANVGVISLNTCLITGNSALSIGSGLRNGPAGCNMFITGSTIAANGPTQGVYTGNAGATMTIFNSIIAGNQLLEINGQITANVQSTIIPGGYAGLPGVINADPMFVPLGFSLQPGSPAIDAGSNFLVNAAAAEADASGSFRFTDDYDTPDTGLFDSGNPDRSIVDIGALEYQPPSPADPGPESIAWVEYRFDAEVMADVLDDRETELWARLYYPDSAIAQPVARPLIVVHHGNHGTCGTGENPRYDFDCTYTDFGYCPMDHVVVPNHTGFDYFIETLVSHGFLVLSINSNRGITCGNGFDDDFGLNLARGRLMLRHLELLALWADNAHMPCGTTLTPGVPATAPLGPSTCNPLPFDITGRIDFSQVGLFGHNRAGEGCRAALHELQKVGSTWPARIVAQTWQPNMTLQDTFLEIHAIFEIGSVDGQAGVTLDADDVAWFQLLPACDGDVWFLDGVRPFDRMLMRQETSAMPKMYWLVWGANHNFFNTEWQVAESPGCGVTHDPIWSFNEFESLEQQAIARSAIVSFFRAFVGPDANPDFARLFDPANDIPADLRAITRIERGWVPGTSDAVSRVFDDFDDIGLGLADENIRTGSNITLSYQQPINYDGWDLPRHDQSLTAARIGWTNNGGNVSFTTELSPSEGAFDVSSRDSLDFRIVREDAEPTLPEVITPLDFSVRLLTAGGPTNTVPIIFHDNFIGPVTGPAWVHTVLHTVRIPLSDFTSGDLTQVTGVQFVFDQSSSGNVYLANIRFSRNFPPACPGDANGDLLVNINDLNLVLGNFGSMGAPGVPGDINDDGSVDINDLNLVLGNFGANCD